MYAIAAESFGKLTVLKLQNLFTSECVEIIPEFGACINALLLNQKRRIYNIIEGYQNEAELHQQAAKLFKSALLFPFPNRVNEGSYAYNGQIFELNINEIDRGHALHGFVWNKPFEVTRKESNRDKAEVWMEYEEKNIQPYFQFTYLIKVVVSLSVNGLKVSTIVTNTSANTMPYGLGWHPYIQMNGKSIDELNVNFPSGEILELDEVMIPTGNTKQLHAAKDEPLAGQELDQCIHLNGKEIGAVVCIYDPASGTAINVWQRKGHEGYHFLQTYTPPHRKSIAIEPQTCAPDALNNKKGLLYLEPQQSHEFEWGIFMNSKAAYENN
jgi:aldose 1-epimerase